MYEQSHILEYIYIHASPCMDEQIATKLSISVSEIVDAAIIIIIHGCSPCWHGKTWCYTVDDAEITSTTAARRPCVWCVPRKPKWNTIINLLFHRFHWIARIYKSENVCKLSYQSESTKHYILDSYINAFDGWTNGWMDGWMDEWLTDWLNDALL